MGNELYIKIAYWYYTLGLTQDEIAKRLSFTRQKVNQIINSLVKLGIVTINIHGYESANIEYECRLEEEFDLKRVIVVTDYGEPGTALLKVANVAAQYLESTIQQKDIIGVSWGRTLSEVINSMSYQKKVNCEVVQLIGAQNMEQAPLKSDEIARGLANKLDCPSYMLYAPVVVENKETKRMLLEEPCIQRSYEHMKRCNIGVFGVGELNENATMCKRGYISRTDIQHLREEGFVADIGMNPVRMDGSWDNCYMQEKILNANMKVINQMDNTVAVASGEDKAEAIFAVLRTGCVDTLIIDEAAAEKIVKML